MAAMRVAFHAYAIEDSSAAGIVERVDRLLTRLAPDHLATAVLVVLDVRQPPHERRERRPPTTRAHRPPTATPSCSSGAGRCPSACGPTTTAPTPAPSRSSPGRRCCSTPTVSPSASTAPVATARPTLLEAIEGFHGTVDELCRLVLLAMLPEHSSDDTCLLAIGID